MAQRHPAGGAWSELTYPELYTKSRAIASGLLDLGVRPGDRVSILSRTCAEWTQADIGAMLVGATLVPIFDTNSAEEVRYVLDDSGARVIFCDDPAQVEKLARGGSAPGLEHTIVFAGEHADAMPLAELEQRGAGTDSERLQRARAGIGPQDLATLVYTSGTTGPPKGCRLTQNSLAINSQMVIDRLPLDPGNVFFTFLPLAHVLTRMVQLVALRVGGTLAYWSGDMNAILDDLAVVKPTHLPSVPRVFEKGYANAQNTAAAGGPVKQALFQAATGVGLRAASLRRQGKPLPPALKLAHAAADRVVLSRVREVFGGRVQLAVCGGAPIDPAILEFFDACGIPICEGWGMTETSAVTTLNPLQGRRFGTVGPALPGAEVRLADDGEVLVRGPHVFSGYEGNEHATADALRDGWLHTGDVGSVDADGYLTLTGRKKEIVVTSSGKNVSPGNVELALIGIRGVSQAVVHGDRRPYLVALLTLDPIEAPKVAADLGIDSQDPSVIAQDERWQGHLAAAVAETNARFAPISQVKRFTLARRELSQEAGEVTASLKIKRVFVQERYAADFERLYGHERGSTDVWLERDRAAESQAAQSATV